MKFINYEFNFDAKLINSYFSEDIINFSDIIDR